MATTPYYDIYDKFFSHITDDMYMELSPKDTYDILQDLLNSACEWFEFPRFDITDREDSYTADVILYCGFDSDYEPVTAEVVQGGCFNCELTQEEQNIIAVYMVVEWLSQQLATVDNVRMKFSGSDFKFTSQANHMSKLTALKTHYTEQAFHLQRLYKRRRKDENGIMQSTMDEIMEDY